MPGAHTKWLLFGVIRDNFQIGGGHESISIIINCGLYSFLMSLGPILVSQVDFKNSLCHSVKSKGQEAQPAKPKVQRFIPNQLMDYVSSHVPCILPLE